MGGSVLGRIGPIVYELTNFCGPSDGPNSNRDSSIIIIIFIPNTKMAQIWFFEKNPDYKNPNFNTKLGIYAENCGLDNIIVSWGHDEYLYLLSHTYLVAKGNNSTLPPTALFIIRFHSFYALHTVEIMSKVKINLEEVKPYYVSLIEKYCPAKLKW
ncbi:hypothetical protein ACH5RR_004129 [Cinchona calisaya]|uniref:Inositol oxygenase n=1 Tax=Cinchona calisaya TaxID=153742 RepID=A0ABD3AXB3_9GENT